MTYKTLLCADSSPNFYVNKEETCLLEDTLRTRGQLFSDYLDGIGVRTNMGFGPDTGTRGQGQDISRTCPGLVQPRSGGELRSGNPQDETPILAGLTEELESVLTGQNRGMSTY